MANLLLIDSREKLKATAKILRDFDAIGVDHVTTKLLFGDYMDYCNPLLVIDRKQSLEELARNCTIDHERFRRELELAKRVGARLVLLVEQNRYRDRSEWIEVSSIGDLIKWDSGFSKIRGEKVYRVLTSWVKQYPLSVRFCTKSETGRQILEILYGGEQ